MMKPIVLTSLTLFLFGLSTTARGDLVLDIQNTTIQSGGYETLNIYLQSTTGLPADAIDVYSVQLTITGPNTLNFTAAGGTGYLDDPTYIFNGNSYAESNPTTSPPYSIPPGYPSPGPTIQIGDFTNDLSPVIPSMTAQGTLLASLQIYAEATNPGESYTVGVDSASFVNLVSTDPDYVPPNYTITRGSIAITGAAVPEPSSIALGLIAIGLVAGFSRNTVELALTC
jgi:hypothetical protein